MVILLKLRDILIILFNYLMNKFWVVCFEILIYLGSK